MKHFEYSFNPSDVLISTKDVISSIGYADAAIPEYLEKQIDDILLEISGMIEPKGGFAVYNKVSVKSKSIIIEKKELKTLATIAGPLAKSDSMAISVCTIGQEVSRWIGTYIKDDPVKGYIADVSASLITDKLAELMHQKVGSYAREELSAKISNRYSPGYCGWSVADQHVLFSLLPSDFCGISLNKAALMFPIKSVSAIIGIGKKLSRKPYPCSKCEHDDCIISKANNQE